MNLEPIANESVASTVSHLGPMLSIFSTDTDCLKLTLKNRKREEGEEVERKKRGRKTAFGGRKLITG